MPRVQSGHVLVNDKEKENIAKASLTTGKISDKLASISFACTKGILSGLELARNATGSYSHKSKVTFVRSVVLLPGKEVKYAFIRFLLNIPSATRSEYASLIDGRTSGFSRAMTSISLIYFNTDD
jgi:hypothetical protein